MSIQRYLTIDDLARPDGVLPYSRVHIYRLVKRGLFPRPVRLSPNRVAWPESEIESWLEARKRERDDALKDENEEAAEAQG